MLQENIPVASRERGSNRHFKNLKAQISHVFMQNLQSCMGNSFFIENSCHADSEDDNQIVHVGFLNTIVRICCKGPFLLTR